MKVRIIVDSSADLIPELKEKLTVIPMVINFGEEEFIDGVTINHQEFYEKLVETDIVPSTSQVTPSTYEEYFKSIEEAGESAVVITLASKLSGTYQSAMIAVAEYENIYIVDSESATIGIGILAELALKLAEDGKTAKEITEILEQEKKKVLVVAMVDTLEYLKRGGRVSKAVAFAGGLLNIKPVISVTQGEINILGKARGSKQGNNLLVTEIEKVGGVDFEKPVLLGYTGLSDALLKKYIEDSKELWSHSKRTLNITVVGSIIGTHAGPDAIAVAFFRK